MEKVKKAYIAPLLTVVEFRTERGYSASYNLIISSQQKIQGFIDKEVEMQMMGELDASGNVTAADMLGNEDYSGGAAGTGWQYDNGSWF